MGIYSGARKMNPAVFVGPSQMTGTSIRDYRYFQQIPLLSGGNASADRHSCRFGRPLPIVTSAHGPPGRSFARKITLPGAKTLAYRELRPEMQKAHVGTGQRENVGPD